MTDDTHSGEFKWCIDESKLPDFQRSPCGKELTSSEFTIGPSIKWVLRCYPNGQDHADDGHCQLHLMLKSFPVAYTSITICYSLHCAQTDSHFRGVKQFQNSNESTAWFRGVFTNEELKALDSAIKTLTFSCRINILQIEAADTLAYECPLNIDLDTKNEFEINWKISGAMLQKFKSVKHGKWLCLPSTNQKSEMWSLQCAPNGYRANDQGSVRLFLQLCALPPNVKSVHLHRKLEFINKKVESLKTNKEELPWGFMPEMRLNSGWNKRTLPRRDIDHFDELHFRATININGYTTNDGKKHETKKVLGHKRKRELSPAKASETDAKEDAPAKKKTKLSVESKVDKDELSDSDIEISEMKSIETNDKIRGGYEWELSTDMITKFKAAKYRKVYQSAPFVIDGLKWCIEVYPLGQNKSDKDSESVAIFLTLLSGLASNISKTTVCWTLYVKPFGTSYTTLSEFGARNNSFGICNGVLRQSEMKTWANTFENKVFIGCKLTIVNSIESKDLKLKKYKQIYPLSVKSGLDGISGDTNEYFQQKCAFEWKIGTDVMRQFKSAYNGKYFESETFNGNMWSLRCAPNGDVKEDEGRVDLMLVMNSMPKGIGKVKVEFKMKCVEGGMRSQLMVHNFNVSKPCAGWDCKSVKKEDLIDKFDALTFRVRVECKLFYDTKNKRIKSL